MQYRFNHEVDDAVMQGERPPILEDTHQLYSTLMQQCWQHDPYSRPSFHYILQQLEDIQSACLHRDEEDN